MCSDPSASSGTPDNHHPYRVILASPSDVEAERRVFERVVEEVNHTLYNLKRNVTLEPLTWEKDAFPDAGVPQEVILRQLLIEQCDIFVGVFWRRFGTPPGGQRPDDARPYLSGTEREVDVAFRARNDNANGRPIIMLYRKVDRLESDMTDEEILQYAKVIEFFKQCQSGGEHQALIREFHGNEFAERLTQHLLQAINELEKSTLRPEQSPRTTDPKTAWLQQVRLTQNPFEHYTAEQEPDLRSYFFSFGAHRPPELIREEKHWFLFGSNGTGKTALARMVENRCYPKNPDSEILCVYFGRNDLQRILEFQPNGVDRFDRLTFLRQFAQKIQETPRHRGLVHASASVELGFSSDQWTTYLNDMGLRQVICLIDQVDELATPHGDDAVLLALLTPLLIPAFRDSLPYRLRYFLPDTIYNLLMQAPKRFRLDRCRVTHLEWTTENLKRLINQRMSQYANPSGSYTSLGELCEAAGGFASSIDEQIAQLAEGCPRAALWLANQLIEVHCQVDSPPRLIDPATWVSVERNWWRWGRQEILGVAGYPETFWVLGTKLFFGAREVNLPGLSLRLLRCLVEAGGSVRTKDELKAAGWPNDRVAGISDRALAEAIRRLRQELKKQDLDTAWVATVHGRGFQLRRPEVTQ